MEQFYKDIKFELHPFPFAARPPFVQLKKKVKLNARVPFYGESFAPQVQSGLPRRPQAHADFTMHAALWLFANIKITLRYKTPMEISSH
jgi:hypothetical protein